MTTTSINALIDETVRRRFEAAWRAGLPLSIASCVPPMDDPHRLGTLEELVLIDLEFVWKSRGQSDAPRIESYLESFPELNRPEIVMRLIEQEYRSRHKAGDHPTPADYALRFPGVNARLVDLPSSIDHATRVNHDTPPTLPGYEILGVLGRGGMGIVFKARDIELDRFVAIKWIRADTADREQFIRFHDEAQATAQLHHPGIVQILSVSSANDRPYLVLEYIDGGTLDDVVKDTPQSPRRAARIVEQVARAVAYAHQRGILHRDLKPSNILLADRMQLCAEDDLPWMPKVADFGLAKRLSVDVGQTATGVVIGTPCYMAPEQALASKDLRPAVDVYALGVILYEAITGRPPFRAATIVETLQQVIHDDPVPLARLQPKTPRDLETICLKCLEKSPQKRYASATEFADDLERFLNGRPVSARPIGRFERLRRWGLRNPRDATLISAIVVVVVIGLAGMTYLWRLAEERRESAETSLSEARTAVKESFTIATEHPVFHADGMSQARKLLLETAAKYFRAFIAQHGEAPHLIADVADAQERIGRITYLIGSPSEALDDYEKARTMYQGLLARNPLDRTNQLRLATVQDQIARLHGELGHTERALQLFAEVIPSLEGFLAEDSENGQLRYHLASAYLRLGQLQRGIDRTGDAHRSLQRCRAVLGNVGPDRPLREQELLASCLSTIGQLQWWQRELREAEVALEEAVTIHELICEQSSTISARNDLSIAYTSLGMVHHSRGNAKESLRLHQLALKTREQLLAREPQMVPLIIAVANSHSYIAEVQDVLKQPDEALRSRLDAIRGYEQALAQDPKRSDPRFRLGRCHGDLYFAYRQRNELERAIEHLNRAAETFRQGLQFAPGLPMFREGAAGCQVVFADIDRNAKRYPEAIEKYAIARREYQELKKGDVLNADYAIRITDIDTNIAAIHEENGNRPEAFRIAVDVLRQRTELAGRYPQDATYQRRLKSSRISVADIGKRYVQEVLQHGESAPIVKRKEAERMCVEFEKLVVEFSEVTEFTHYLMQLRSFLAHP